MAIITARSAPGGCHIRCKQEEAQTAEAVTEGHGEKHAWAGLLCWKLHLRLAVSIGEADQPHAQLLG